MRRTFLKRSVAVLLCVVLCVSVLCIGSLAAARDTSYEATLAQDLKDLKLFKGISDTEFDLNRAPTRVEALVMLIRVLGKESAALSGTWSHPFTDVPAWADSYVGYAYQKGLTNGISATEFGTMNANAQMYVTFVLRALGYSDVNGLDFTFAEPYTLAKSVGILPDCVNISDFWRADVVLVSYAALACNLKNSTQTLAQKLISDGVFTGETFNAVYDPNAIANFPKQTLTVLDAEQVYAKCSPAVFYIEVADSTGTVYASGSGFFIAADGTAVTNYHVIDGAYSATVTLSTTNAKCSVTGVYDYDVDDDWAIIKIEGYGYPYLEIADTSTIVGGARCYAIGSPRGLQNSISDGIISNPNQVVGGQSYIQTSAAISHGSSGGALINKYGQVIGITCGIYENGENLGFAVPITKINGYSHSQCTALSAIFPGKNSSTSQNALDYLAAFAYVCHNEMISGDYVYSEKRYTDTGNITYRICYDDSVEMVYVQRIEQYYSNEYWTTIVFEPDSAYHDVYYTYYDSLYTADPAFDAYSYVYAPGFLGNNMRFTEIESNTGYNVTTNENIASYDLKDALYFVDFIYDEYLSEFGDFGVYLFGFSSYLNY